MPDNELGLMEWQVGKQSAFATAVTPTAKLMGISTGSSITPFADASAIIEERNSLIPSYGATLDRSGGNAKLSGDANFEQLGYVLDSLLGEATPTGVGPYVYAYDGPVAKPTPRIMTLVRGGNIDVRNLTGAIAGDLSLKFESNRRVTFESNFFGYEVASDSLAALSDTDVNYIHANQADIYIDAWGGTMGSTALTASMFSGELSINMNKAAKYSVGSKVPIDYYQRMLEAGSNQLKLSIEQHTQSVAWFNSITTATNTPLQLQVRILFTADANHKLQLDFAGFVEGSPDYVSDNDGVGTLEFTLNAMYHSDLSSWLNIELTNQVATLP